MELLQSFTLNFLKMDRSLLSESLHIWVMGTLEGQPSFHKFWPQGGAGGQNLWHFKKCYGINRFSHDVAQKMCA